MQIVSLLGFPCFTIVLEPEEQQKAKNAWSLSSRAWHQVDGCKVDVLEGGQKEPNQALYSWSNSRCSCDGNYLGSLVRNSLSSLVSAYLKMIPPMYTSNFLTSCMRWIRPGLYLFFHFSLCNMVNTSSGVGGFGMRLANNFDMYVDILTSCILSSVIIISITVNWDYSIYSMGGV